ncbi:threonine synthase [Carnobacteriaceae bacterium zg-ZUI252]|nr:threonine synthase [Carnobacteriaceae bacterium zg-ZUI252]MBS4769589.1 threonine synthase [Carnobacteriaceae bacterium zg-ZUI240]QTU83052.1 threonine synthase [Carnobacteriaceae bacterium zg-C25]
MTYTSTRDNTQRVTASQAILNGISSDGGLYVLDKLPTFATDTLERLVGATYQEVAKAVLPLFLDDFTPEEIDYCIQAAYNTKNFSTDDMVALHTVNHHHYLELFHGKTLAFKDMALSILPYLMQISAKKNALKNELVILTATSGDTGKAALEAFHNVEGIHIFVFYPKNGVSAIQEHQMVSQVGDNVHVFGITGNFDDAQTKVKHLFNDATLNNTLAERGYQFSSANSINIGRLVPQIVYYVYAYTQLVANKKIEFNQSVNVSVPTGNFGNILAAYYAKALGVPFNTLLCASNENNVLSDFFQSGTYDKNRPFIVTNSPSMDILVSSNLERLIYHATGNDATQTKALMTQLNETGQYTLESDTILNDFIADTISQSDTLTHIRDVFESNGYVIDPHTAVASALVSRYESITNDVTPTIIASTASPFKFANSVLDALNSKYTDNTPWDIIDALSHQTQLPLPQALVELKQLPVRFNQTIDTSDMANVITSTLKG